MVQFVPFRAGQGKTGSQVAKDVLNEIPRQLVQVSQCLSDGIQRYSARQNREVKTRVIGIDA